MSLESPALQDDLSTRFQISGVPRDVSAPGLSLDCPQVGSWESGMVVKEHSTLVTPKATA